MTKQMLSGMFDGEIDQKKGEGEKRGGGEGEGERERMEMGGEGKENGKKTVRGTRGTQRGDI